MFDQSSSQRQYQYEDETEVVDVEEPSRPRLVVEQPVRGRVPTGELTVHVVHAGRRHRRLPDLSGTSCGQKYHSGFAPVFREELTHKDGRLCEDGCFTETELAIADREEAKRVP